VYFMNETWKWDDLRLFLAVARGNGLAKAAPLTRSSAPTLSRRMTALERALGRTLFLRHRNGYDLTQAGEELLGLAEAVEAGTLRIERWRSAEDPNPVVKIAAGVWTSAFLARHMAALVADRDALRVEILSGAAPADLLRREANLGLRNHRPETPGLAGRRVAHVAFAVYGETAYVRDRPEARDERRYAACRWIAFSPPGPKVPSAVWLEQQVLADLFHGPGRPRGRTGGRGALCPALFHRRGRSRADSRLGTHRGAGPRPVAGVPRRGQAQRAHPASLRQARETRSHARRPLRRPAACLNAAPRHWRRLSSGAWSRPQFPGRLGCAP
jgi:DNA-binding transcriptional LysR family regulator